MIAHARRGPVGFGVAQQHQAAHWRPSGFCRQYAWADGRLARTMASRHQGAMTEAEQSPYGPTWYAATMVAVPERRALTHDLDVDVCVIGGGLAGLTVAREVARRGWSVAVLEARPGRGRRIGAQWRLRVAGICRAHRGDRRARRTAAREGIVGAVGRRRRIYPPRDRRDRDARRRWRATGGSRCAAPTTQQA